LEKQPTLCANLSAVLADDNSNKLYSLHAPEVECISKGKAHKSYLFDVKVRIEESSRSNFVICGLALPGNPYDGYTLQRALDQMRALCGPWLPRSLSNRKYGLHLGAEVRG